MLLRLLLITRLLLILDPSPYICFIFSIVQSIIPTVFVRTGIANVLVLIAKFSSPWLNILSLLFMTVPTQLIFSSIPRYLYVSLSLIGLMLRLLIFTSYYMFLIIEPNGKQISFFFFLTSDITALFISSCSVQSNSPFLPAACSGVMILFWLQ